MRPAFIFAILVAVAVAIGGFVWYNNQPQQAGLDAPRTDPAAQVIGEDTAATQPEATPDQAASTDQGVGSTDQTRQAVEADELVEQNSPVPEAAVTDQGDAIVIGDEITDDSIVVQSITVDPVMLDPAEVATSAEIIDTTEGVGADATFGTGATDSAGSETVGGGDTATFATTETAPTDASAIGPEDLLTPANFDREGVLALIDGSPQLSDTERSTLRAVVEGASANPAMVEGAVESIRAALNMPSLN